MKRLVATAVSLTVAAAALAGCSPSAPTPSGTEPAGSAPATDQPTSKRIALIFKAVGADFWTAVSDGAMKAGEDTGFEVTINGTDTESESDKQINMLQSAINDTPAGIGLDPQDGSQESAPKLLEQAIANGTKVIIFDTPLVTADDAFATVASDNVGMGAQAAENMVNLIGQTGKVAILTHGEIGSAAMRRDGFSDYIKQNAPGIEIVDVQNGESDPAKSRDKAQGMMQAHPDLLGIYGTDDDSTIAAADEVAAKGANVKVVGIDTSPDVMTLLNDGKIAGVVSQDPFNMGYLTVKTLADEINGTPPAEKIIVVPSVWVTKDNQDDPAVKQVLRTA